MHKDATRLFGVTHFSNLSTLWLGCQYEAFTCCSQQKHKGCIYMFGLERHSWHIRECPG